MVFHNLELREMYITNIMARLETIGQFFHVYYLETFPFIVFFIHNPFAYCFCFIITSVLISSLEKYYDEVFFN